MKLIDTFQFAVRSLTAHRLRTLLSASGIAIGIAAVTLLTAIGDGVQRFVLSEFTQFGTNIVNISPGKINTHGGSLGAIGSARLLTIEDALSLKQSRYAQYTNANVVGNAEISARGRSRRVTAYGQGPDFAKAFNMQVAIGQFLPDDDPRNPRAYVVLGAKVHKELFGDINPLGTLLQVGGSRFRIVGVMASKGQVLGFDFDDTVFIPIAHALEVFNRQGVMEINFSYSPDAPIQAVIDDIRTILIGRHGREDFTVKPQQQMLSTLSTVLSVLKFSVAALGGISLLVGTVGMITLMHITVSERISEIGLLTALGATRTRIRILFLWESIVLSSMGGLAGLIIGASIAWLLKLLINNMPLSIPWNYVFGALGLSILIGLAAGVIPAMRAAKLNPIDALRIE